MLPSRALASTRVIPFKGINFRDITPLLMQPQVFSDVVDWMAEQAKQMAATSIGGIESRGFVFAAAVAVKLGLPLVLFRKPGKLPGATMSCTYQKEYGPDNISVHVEDINPEDKVVVIDDVLATGGTAEAAGTITTTIAGAKAGFVFLFEVKGLPGREILTKKYQIATLAEC